MTGFSICVRMQLWKGSEYSRISSIQVSAYGSVAQGFKYAWIWLNNALWQSSKYAWSTFHRVLNKGSKCARTQNMARLWICEGYTWYWICLNKPEYALIMSQYTWVSLSNAEYDLKFRHIPEKKQSAEYATILNVSDAVHSIRALHKLLSTYQERRIQNTVKHLRWSVLQKE